MANYESLGSVELTKRLKRLIEIDRILCEAYPDKLSANDILRQISESINIKTIRNDLKLFQEIQAEFKNKNGSYKYEIIKDSIGRTSVYTIPPGKSFFRQNFSSSEIKLLQDILVMLGKFDGIPGLENLDELSNLNDNILSKECAIVDLSIKPYYTSKSKLFARLFQAISECLVLEVQYRRITELESEEILREIVRPYQLKLFGNRWVLICAVNSNGFIINFSLDQIVNFKIVKDKYAVPLHFNPAQRERVKKLYEYAIGPTIPHDLSISSEGEPYGVADTETIEDIVLYALPHRANHLMSFPIIDNDTQDELPQESEYYQTLMVSFPELPQGGSIFTLRCYPYRELKEAIMMRMDSVIVLKPDSLREDIAKRISTLSVWYDMLKGEK